MLTRVRTLPIWARIIGVFVLVMALATGGTIYCSLRQQNRIALEHATAFAATSAHLAYTAIGLAMASGDPKEIRAVISEIQKSEGLKSLRVIATDSLRQQLKISGREKIDAFEQQVMN